MTNILVAYDSKYGNTKRAAETIAEGMKDVEDIEISVVNVKKTDARNVAGYDVLVLGAPNHMASPSRTMTKYIESLARLDLKAKNTAVFGTYSGRLREPDKAVRKMEKEIEREDAKDQPDLAESIRESAWSRWSHI